ncbi:BrnT family toxin [Mannheimia granulomatis]|uniref:BrnT family toxin n=1 Tax=Mannheimia granulomatis TaxID=85402 RepID=UPI001F1A52B0|nr:BrnT family toxin [Mannheimia granulomatis]
MKIYTWDETKRQINLEKHGLDFADADEVLSSPYRFDVETIRNNELTTQSCIFLWSITGVIPCPYRTRRSYSLNQLSQSV